LGMAIGPPKASDAPKPISSIKITRTFGAPSGASTVKRAGSVASRTSSSSYRVRGGSTIGSTVRSIPSDEADAGVETSLFWGAQDHRLATLKSVRRLHIGFRIFLAVYVLEAEKLNGMTLNGSVQFNQKSGKVTNERSLA
jgi:hypothetical protein